jgi:hypothetical protein
MATATIKKKKASSRSRSKREQARSPRAEAGHAIVPKKSSLSGPNGRHGRNGRNGRNGRQAVATPKVAPLRKKPSSAMTRGEKQYAVLKSKKKQDQKERIALERHKVELKALVLGLIVMADDHFLGGQARLLMNTMTSPDLREELQVPVKCKQES